MRFVVHIGVGKTGTTTLQNGLFRCHPEIVSIGRPYSAPVRRRAINDIIFGDESDVDLRACRDLLCGECPQRPDDGRTRSIILSEETIANNPWPTAMAERLHRLFRDADILVVLRNQLTALPSAYAAHGRRPSGNVSAAMTRQQVPFDDWFEDGMSRLEQAQSTKLDHAFFRCLDYRRLLRPYRRAFGAEHVRVMLYEDFAERPTVFVEELCDWLGVDAEAARRLLQGRRENMRTSARALAYDRLRARLPAVSIARLVPFGKKLHARVRRVLNDGEAVEVRMSPQQIERVHQAYAKSNAWLEDQLGLDLRGRGYPV